MRCTALTLLFLTATFSGVVTQAHAQGKLKAGWHEDTRNGFKVKIPDKWECVPISVDEKWIVTKYLGDRALIPKKTDLGYTEMKPQLRVIIFTDEARKHKPAELENEKLVGDALTAFVKAAQVPYKDYKDYLARNAQEGGYHFASEKEAKVGGLPCWQYEIKFEKLTIPRRAVAWMFRGDAADYVVEFEVLEDHWEKYAPSFLASLQSFKFIKRDTADVGTAGGSTGAARAEVGDSTDSRKRAEWKALSAKERAERRKSTEVSRFRRVKDSLPPGWTSQMTPNFLVVSHADQKFTDKVVENAGACRYWLDKNIGPINDEYVMRGVIRVCANWDEYRAFSQTSGDAWASDSREIVTYKGANMGTRSGFENLYVGMMVEYLRDKDPLVASYAPPWIRFGLTAAISGAVADGKTLKLGRDEWELMMFREALKSGAKPTARSLMESTSDDFGRSMNMVFYPGPLVRHFFNTKKDFIIAYLKASSAAAEEYVKIDRAGQKEATTEEEEEAQMKQSREAGKKHSGDMVKKVNAQMCNWSEKEWQNLEAAFAASLK